MRQFLLPRDFSYPHPDGTPGRQDYPEVSLRLEGRDYHYLVHVLRYEKGAEFPGVDHEGGLYNLRITEIDREGLSLSVRRGAGLVRPGTGEQNTELFLFQALLKGKKMDTVIRQAAETGIGHIVPLVSDHTVVQLDTPAREVKKLERWNTIIGEAQQQSGSTIHSQLHPPLPTRELGPFWRQKSVKSAISLFFHQYPLENGSLHGYLSNCPPQVALVIGPEGGFSAAEIEHMRTYGFLPVHLQTNILRAETAAIYVIGAVQSILQEREQWQIIP